MKATVTFSKFLASIDRNVEGNVVTFPSMNSAADWIKSATKNPEITITAIDMGAAANMPVYKITDNGEVIIDLKKAEA